MTCNELDILLDQPLIFVGMAKGIKINNSNGKPTPYVIINRILSSYVIL